MTHPPLKIALLSLSLSGLGALLALGLSTASVAHTGHPHRSSSPSEADAVDPEETPQPSPATPAAEDSAPTSTVLAPGAGPVHTKPAMDPAMDDVEHGEAMPPMAAAGGTMPAGLGEGLLGAIVLTPIGLGLARRQRQR